MTRSNALPLVALLAALGGCATQVAEQPEVTSTMQAVTLEECADQRDACYAANPFFGLLTCPLQYNQCVLTAEDGIPAAVTAAISDAAMCADEARDCRAAATSPADLLLCTEQSAVCVGAIVDAEIPTVVSGTLACVDGAIDCIGASETVGDLAGCAETLEVCAIEEAISVLPPAVVEVAEDIGACQLELTTCTIDASTPIELAACSDAYVICISDGLGVDLPTISAADALGCAETAAACTLDAGSLASLGACADGLIECTTAIVEEELTCEQQWTACVNANPFNFLGCTAELAFCRD